MLEKRLMLLISIFFVCSAAYAATADVPETGQTTPYASGDDGDLQKGIAWPSPRFTDNLNGTVTDNLTGLIWLRNSNCFGPKTWADALTAANNLASGSCELTDGSAVGQWRLPNVNELESLLNASQSNSAEWLNGQGFINVYGSYYWSSTTYAGYGGWAWGYSFLGGDMDVGDKSISISVWPVRAGQ